MKLLHQASYSGLKIVIMAKVTKFSVIKYHVDMNINITEL